MSKQKQQVPAQQRGAHPRMKIQKKHGKSAMLLRL
jgi:hypothetical protein